MVAATGLGSGIDIDALVTGLVAAEKSPIEQRLAVRESELAADQAAFASIKSAVAALEDTVESLASADTFADMKATSSDYSNLGVTVSSSAQVGSYSVEITRLAQSQSLASSAYTSTTSVVGTGTLSLSFGTPTYDGSSPASYSGFSANSALTAFSVDITSENNTLSGIRDAINAKNGPVSASILSDGSGYRLMLSATNTGVDSSIKIEVSSDGDSNNTDAAGLSALAFDESTNHLQEMQAATDAAITFNGLSITSSSNEIKDVVDGVTLTLKATNTAADTVIVSRDTGEISSKVKDFTDKYNAFIKLMSELMMFDSEANTRGQLQGDSTARMVMNHVRQLISTKVSGLAGDYTTLSAVGVTTQKDNTLKFDESAFSTAISADFSSVKDLFSRSSASDRMDGIAVSMNTTLDSLLASSGVLESRNDSIRDQLKGINSDREALNKRFAAVEARYFKQFNAMDSLLSEITSTGEFLNQQMSNLPGTNRSKK